jgi:hypothetical protein
MCVVPSELLSQQPNRFAMPPITCDRRQWLRGYGSSDDVGNQANSLTTVV